MNLAAIDIGSNAVRLFIVRVIKELNQHSFKTIEFVRVPMQLGEDVFNLGKIGPEKETQFIDLIRSFKTLIKSYEVQDYMACATSSLREASNGNDIAKKIKKELGIQIDILDGPGESEIIFQAVLRRIDYRDYLHVEVGGGSTDLNIISNHKKVTSQSFNIGTLRQSDQKQNKEEWVNMRTWVKFKTKSYKELLAIGTGGNIAKIYSLANIKDNQHMSLNKMTDVIHLIKNRTLEERVNILKLNPDRAELIIPASDIYLSILRWANISKIVVPNVGLKEGIIQMLYSRVLTKETVEI
ncbi:MAG: hypothetical protein A3H98_00640 [Bacteroidetes bacterium RIFCSPLOWO2_02_FULL_36_8]|nr:MAG: hypothetical protein A3H98_00640 [Bacteroidetes bacterium RIFCSPLOWO2_02_FULL_36_8]OFY69425.1 MAG: hypothetical protein A3G23_00700 [Bacteroidetes bacterium RIFCSPLOWO2_12_FULL_37_12]